MSTGTRVYLAGKIDRTDWRHGVVDGLTDACFGIDPSGVWPVLERAVFGRYDYVGPFFAESGGHGAGHEPHGHGLGVGSAGGESVLVAAERLRVAQRRTTSRCLVALKSADVVFAWLDDPTAYGTLIEIGFVVGQCLAGRTMRLVIARPEQGMAVEDYGGHGVYCAEADAMWFASALGAAEHVRAPDPASALRAVLAPPATESPAEEAFWAAWRAGGGPDLAVQHEVLGGRYRLDFAHLASRTAIEIDGLAYHNGQTAFQRDRERDRRLTAAGWRVVRFTAKEVFANGAKCAAEALAFCRSDATPTGDR